MEQEKIDYLKNVEGFCRGVSLQTPLAYVENNFGKEKLLLVEEELVKIGIPTKKEVLVMQRYPLGYMTLLHLTIKETLNWTDEDIKEMGYNLPKISFFVKMLTKHFISTRKTFEAITSFWSNHFTVGRIIPYKIDEEEKYLIIRIEDYKTDPIDCKLFEGYFSIMAMLATKAKEVKIEETKCIYRGDEFHEYVIKWE